MGPARMDTSPRQSVPLRAARSPNLLVCFLLTLWVFVRPRASGRQWVRIPLWKALALANLNLLVLSPAIIQFSLNDIAIELLLAPITVCFIVYLLVFAMLFFVLMPFAPQPGSNRACLRHVLRTVLLSTSLMYFWAAVFFLFYLALRYLPSNPADFSLRGFHPDAYLAYITCGAALLAWTTFVLARAVGIDYRAPEDFPQPRTPRCDECGYDLRATDPASRCPECGRPVADSVGPAARAQSPWETCPSYLNFRNVIGQLFQMIFNPQSLYRRIPLFSGHAAARRWLVLMLLLVAAMAFFIAPALSYVSFPLSFADWELYAAGFSIAVVWTFLGLMMVGIETTGIATVGYFRGNPVELASASKVTCYASTLLLFWVLVGGLQLVAITIYAQTNLPKRVGIRMDSLITVGSLAAAHVLGLLWFEWTVYRGLRAIQYANH